MSESAIILPSNALADARVAILVVGVIGELLQGKKTLPPIQTPSIQR